MAVRPIRSVLFDLDNTLIDRSEAFVRLFTHWYRVLPKAGRPADKKGFASRMALRGNGYEPIADIYQDMLDEWPGCFASLEEAVEAHFNMIPCVVAIHATTEAMLKRFRTNGIPVGVVTNGDSETQRGKLRNTGVDSLVVGCVVSEEVGVRKPDPAIFHHALGLLNAEAGSTLFVGDNAEEDIVGAASLNMLTAWISLGREWELGSHFPDHAISEVWEVEQIVNKANGWDQITIPV